jgi:ComEC/Rec2-related protein
VRLAGPLALPSPPEAPGRFDARAFLAGRGVFYTLRAADNDASIVAPGSDAVAMFVRAAGAVRTWGIGRLHAGLETDPLVGQLLTGIVLGQRDEVPPAALFPFRHTGTYHLFSTNGGDLALLLAIVLGALKLCGVIRWRWGWVLAPLLLFYALVSGSQPSVIRGFAAALMILAAWAVGRPVQPLNLWGLSLFAVLTLWPRAALDLGFQFSFLIVLSLLLLAAPCIAWLEKPFSLDPYIVPRLAPPWRRWQSAANTAVAAVLGSCAAAWIASVGLETAYFHQLCLVGIPANALGVPLAGLVFTVGLCSLAGGALWGQLSVLFNNANWVFAKALLIWVGLLSHLPDASIYLPLGAGNDREPQFTIASAGYGTATLVRYRGQAWLLNPSDERGFFHDVDATRKYLGVNRLSGVVVGVWASPESSATPLLPAVLPTGPFCAPPWGTSRRPSPWAQRTLDDLHPEAWTVGTRTELAPGLAVTVLSPDPANPARLAEDRGLVLLFEHGASRLLYAGTVGFGIEARVLAANDDLRADVLVEGRHSTESNLSEPWLRQVAPHDIVLIDRRGPSRLHNDFLSPLPDDAKPRLWDQAETGAMKITLHTTGGATVEPWEAQPETN